MFTIVREALLLAIVGLALGLAANALRDDGLTLTRDHFPAGPLPAATSSTSAPDGGAAIQPATGSAATRPVRAAPEPDAEAPALADLDDQGAADSQPTPPADEGLPPLVVERLAAKGLTPVTHAEAEALWRDPMHQQYGATLFVDARRAEQYAAGHLPGAYHFDPFYPERHLDALLPLLPAVQTVVVYCAGGECDDSESAALYLQQYGVPAQNLRVYVGGMGSWTAARLPLEVGERGSGATPESDG